jgi:hypothetical protein
MGRADAALRVGQVSGSWLPCSLLVGLAAGAVCAPAFMTERAAFAQDAPPPSPPAAPAAASAPVCRIAGTQAVTKGVTITDAPAGGRTLALFTGADLPLELRDLPADPSAGRSRVATSAGKAGFRIEGFVQTSAIHVFTGRDIPAVGAQVWLSSAHEVRLVAASGNALGVERTILGSPGQTLRVTAPCDALSLQKGAPVPFEIPANGRGYTMRGSSVELFDAPNGSAVLTLKVSEGVSHLFWSSESKAGFVHVKFRSDISVDAWVRLRELEPLKKGEMMDVPDGSSVVQHASRLGLDKPPRVVQATKDIPLRAKRDTKEAPIGVIEAGAEVYVVETVTEWANVLPKHLGVIPPDDGGFWVPASELP